MENIYKQAVCFFTKDNCPYCVKLENDLQSLSIPFEKVIVTEEFRDNLIEHTKCKTVPQLFIGGKFIGGYKEFCELAGTPRLLEVLQPLGIIPNYDF